MKQIKLTFVLTTLMSMVGLQAFAAWDTSIQVNDVCYYLDNDNNLAQVRSKFNEGKYTGHITIPSSFTYNSKQYNVTSIGDNAFYLCSDLTSVTIPNSVTSIGDNAFQGCVGLTSVTIPNSVTSIGNNAFFHCDDLTSVTIGNSVTSIGETAFADCFSLTSVTIPNSVTSIGDAAFGGCSGLTAIIIGNGITSIGNSAFNGCSGLTSVTIPNSVTSIGDRAFYWCSGLTSVTIPNSVTSIGREAFTGCKIESLIIPNSVTSIGEYAFRGCGKESIEVESGNTKYDSRNNCNALIETASNKLIVGCKNTVIPNSVTSIGAYAFYFCSGLTSVTIPNSVTNIGNYSFHDCQDLISVTIGNSVTRIGSNSFQYCNKLTSVTIGNSVTSIGDAAFNGCSMLTTVTIDINTPLTIGSGTIANRANATLYVPAGCMSAYEAADYWTDFKEIIEMGKDMSSSDITINSIDDVTYNGLAQTPIVTVMNRTTTLTCGTHYTVAYSNNTNAGTATVTITGMGNNTGTKSANFTINKAALTVSANSYVIRQGDAFPEFDVTYLGFQNGETSSVLTTQPVASCSASSSNIVGTYDIVVGGGVAQNYEFNYIDGTLTIGSPIIDFADQYAKSACVAAWDTDHDGELSMQEAAAVTSLSDATFDKNMTSFDELVYFTGLTSIISFQSYTKLTSIVIPSNVTSLPNRAFWGCTDLSSVTVPNSVTSIGQYAFYNCRNLLSITIPSGVTSIGWYAFYNCSSLTSITIPNGINVIDQSTFYGCSGLTSIVIPNGVTSIGSSAFRNCTSLATVTIPNSVITIGQYAFAQTGLTSIVIPSSVTSIGNDAFSFCEKIASISVESGNGKYDSRDNCNAIINTSTNKLLYGSNNTTIPNSVTSIGERAFSYRKGLTSITIPNSVTSIGESAFNNCTGLTSVTIPNSVTSIAQSTFSSCSGLISVSIPNSVTSIDYRAFLFCSSLTSVTIPNSVTSIGSDAFIGCSGLTSVTIPNSVTSIGSDAFYGCSGLTSMTVRIEEPINLSGSICAASTISLYVPASGVDAYKAANYWKNFKEILAIVKNEQTLDFTTIPTMTYGDATYTLPETTEEGRALTWTVANTNVATVSANILTIHGAGLTTVTATNVGDENYEDFSREFGLVVNKASLVISATDKSMTYGDFVPSLEIEYSGFKNDETETVLTTQPTITCSATQTSNAGVYAIQVSEATAANYDITHISGTMTINKAPLTITAKSYTINQKDDLPEFEVTYDGFKNAQTSSVLTTLPTITCDATDSETAGDFDIIPSGAAATNYSFNYVSGTLTVNEVESVTIAMRTGSGDARNMIAYSSKYALDFTDRPELKAYIACGYNSNREVLLVHVSVVPPYTGMVIKTTNGIYDGGDYDVPTTTEDYYYANLLVPVVETETVTPTEIIDDVEYTNFTIGTLVGGGIGFVKLNSNWTTHNKSYLRVPTSLYNNTAYANAIKGFGVEFVEGERATAILNAKHDAQENEDDYYDLLGRKVKPISKGFYIHKGKKMFIK